LYYAIIFTLVLTEEDQFHLDLKRKGKENKERKGIPANPGMMFDTYSTVFIKTIRKSNECVYSLTDIQ
jgi:uncharacterized protein Veg